MPGIRILEICAQKGTFYGPTYPIALLGVGKVYFLNGLTIFGLNVSFFEKLPLICVFLSHPFINGCDLHFEFLHPSSSSFPDNFTLAGTK